MGDETKDPEDIREERPDAPMESLEELAEVRERIEALRARLREVRSRASEVAALLAKSLATGRGEAEEAGSLRRERQVLRDEREELEAALPILTRHVKERREAILSDQAAARLREIKKICGGQAGEHPRRIRRLGLKAASLRADLNAIAHVYVEQGSLRRGGNPKVS